MAYENVTYEVILNRMMSRVSNSYPNLDTREGSILFNALAPAALELAIMYAELDNVLSESFVATASRGYLLTACSQMGMNIAQFNANAGTHKGVFDVEVSIGSKWNCDLYNYIVTEYIGLEDGYYAYQMLCETAGTAPNTVAGDLTAITEVPQGLTYAKVVECLIEGEDETPDNKIREAYYDYVNSVAVDGNVKQYEQWCDSYEGIGNAKVFPLWNGANTVKVSILSASNGVASEELVNKFQQYLDPNSEGMGNGVAPIGAVVTVTTASELPVNVSATVKLKAGYTDTSDISKTLVDYFSQIAYTQNTISYMKVGAVILESEVVESINNLTINGGTADVVLGAEEIPVLGNTNWAVN